MRANLPNNIEYERRFVVVQPSVLEGHVPNMIAQAYLFVRGGWSIRVRRIFHRSRPGVPTEEWPAMLTVKGPRKDLGRAELEWEIPQEIATELFRRSDMKIVKGRYEIIDAGTTWDVDEFYWENQGLVLAECEMHDVDALASLQPPAWCGKEVTNDPRYSNEELARHPYKLWDYLY